MGNCFRDVQLSALFARGDGTARCVEEDQLLSDEQYGPYLSSGRFTEQACRARFAHTSSIYVTVGVRGVFVASSVKEAQQMLKAFERFARKTAKDEHLAEILDPLPKEIKSRA